MIPGIIAGGAVTSTESSAPIILSNTHSGFDASANTHNVSMPSVVDSGDLLIALVTSRRALGGTISMEPTPSGFTLLGKQLTGASTTQFHVFYRNANGTEGGTTVDFDTPQQVDSMDVQVIRIQAGSWGATPEATFAADSGADLNPDPPSHASAWSGLAVLWFSCFGSNGQAAPSAWSLPNSQTATTTGGGSACRVISCTVNSSAGTLDPNPFTMGANTRWAAATVAVRPA